MIIAKFGDFCSKVRYTEIDKSFIPRIDILREAYYQMLKLRSGTQIQYDSYVLRLGKETLYRILTGQQQIMAIKFLRNAQNMIFALANEDELKSKLMKFSNDKTKYCDTNTITISKRTDMVLNSNKHDINATSHIQKLTYSIGTLDATKERVLETLGETNFKLMDL